MKRFKKKETHCNEMKGTTLLLIFTILFFNIFVVSAANIDPATQGDTKLIYQTCNNCTYCNISRVTNQDDIVLVSNLPFDKDGTYYSKTLDAGNSSTLGTHTYCYDCGNTVESETGCIDYEVTPTGRDGSSNIVFFVIVIVLVYGITFMGFFYSKNIPITILGGMLMIFLGLYMIRNGIIIYRDDLTNYLSYVTTALGFIISSWASLEWFDII